MTVNNRPTLLFLAFGVFLLPLQVQAQQHCEAHFTFNGDLQDAGGNAYHGQMIGKEGAVATPRFVEGKFGQALQLDGSSAMRSFIDLHFESCPQVTVTAWIQSTATQKGTQYLVSTGSGSGPGLRVSGTNLTLSGTANGINQSNAVRANAGWMFIAGVYDYEKGSYTLYWRNRSVEKELGNNVRAPEEALWVGAFNDGLAGPATGILIDDLRIQGKALSANEIQLLRKTTPTAGESESADRDGLTPNLPTPIPGMSDRLPTTTPTINPDALPDSPIVSLPGGASEDPGSGIVLLDPPETGDPNVLNPNLTPQEGLAGEQLREDIDTALEGAQKQFDEEQRQHYQRSFGPRDRAQVVIARNGELAYATGPSLAIGGPAGFGNMTLGLRSWGAGGKQIMEVFRISGANVHIAVADDGTLLRFGDNASGRSNRVFAELSRLAGLAKPIDLVADQMGDYLIISGTEVYASGVPQGAVDWAESELADGVQVTAMALLNGDAWIGVSNREVASGGMNRSHWGLNLLTDIKRFAAAGERIEDIHAGVATVSDKWAIATDKRIFVKGFPECETYDAFGASVESNLSREWDCFYKDRSCLAARATWSEQDMGSNPDPNIWEVNLLATIGATEYDDGPKARDDFECWLEEGLQRTELLFGDSPRLKIRLRTQRKTRVDGVDLSNFIMETDTKYTSYMDRNFDIMAKSKREGYYQLLITNSVCIGYDSDGSRHCIGGRAKFPHSVSPLTRKHGIIMTYPDDRDHVLAHEFGHYLGLIHTFAKTSPFSTALRCNYEYLDENVSNLICATCRNGIINSTDETCTGDFNVMDYCDGDNDRTYLNQCQKDRASSQRDAYLTNDGHTNYFKMKGRQGEPYCDEDSDCLNDEYCNKGVASVGRNVCKSKLDDGAACSRGGQCESGKCSVFSCRSN